MTTVLQARPRQFVNTPSVERVVSRALRYLQSGFSVHLRGPAGTGKTTLALHLADLLSRPIMLMFGDDEFKTSDLIGNQAGYTRKKVVDNYIHSVVKIEDELRQNWVDSRLTLACREGFTLVYDEFNRSRPEVNNVLLSALEEKLLVLPPSHNRTEYIRVSSQFRAILTSNPEEYCGVHSTQDALMDRLITINIPEPDELTQQEIAIQKTGVDRESAALIVQLVKAFRARTGAEKSSGLRSCLMLAKICHQHEVLVMPENAEFRDICQDILLSRTNLPLVDATRCLWDLFNEMIAADLPLLTDSAPSISDPVELADDSIASNYIFSLPTELMDTEPLGADGVIQTQLIEPPTVEALMAASRMDESMAAESMAAESMAAESMTLEPIATEPAAPATPETMMEDPDIENGMAMLTRLMDLENDRPEPTTLIQFDDDNAFDLDIQPSIEALEMADIQDDIASVVEAIALEEANDDAAVASEAEVSFVETVPYEQDVYDYIEDHPNVRLPEIETALGLKRSQAINALQTLIARQLIVAQGNQRKPSYRIRTNPQNQTR